MLEEMPQHKPLALVSGAERRVTATESISHGFGYLLNPEPGSGMVQYELLVSRRGLVKPQVVSWLNHLLSQPGPVSSLPECMLGHSQC